MRKQTIAGYLTLVISHLLSLALRSFSDTICQLQKWKGWISVLTMILDQACQGGRAPAHNRQEANEKFSSFHPDSAASAGTIASLILQ